MVPALGVAERRGQHAEVFAEQDIPVDLGFIVPERNDAALQVAADACIQRVAKLQKCRCLAAVDAAADVVFAQPVGDTGRAAGVAVIGELIVRFGVERRVLHDQQVLALFSAGQKHLPRDGLHELGVGVEEEDVVKRFQRLLLLQKNLKPAQRGKRPGVGFLRTDMHAGVVVPGQGRSVGKDEVVDLAVLEQVFLGALIKFRPEHRVPAGGDVERRDLSHAAPPPRRRWAAQWGPMRWCSTRSRPRSGCPPCGTSCRGPSPPPYVRRLRPG